MARRGRARSRPPRVSAREERRRLGYRLLQRGVPRATIARQLGVSYLTVHTWAKRRREGGPDSWRDVPHRGAEPRLSAAQKRRLLALLKKGARARGYPTDRWTLKRVAEVIRQEYGVEYSLSGVWRALRALGLSAQVPLTRALERNDEHIRDRVRHAWPEIFRAARRAGATAAFVDESGVPTTPSGRRRRAVEASRPALRTKGHREYVSVTRGVTLSGEHDFECHRNDLSGTEGIGLLQPLPEEIRGRVVVVWDNINIHRSAEVATFLGMNRQRLQARRLPPYAPERNPDEAIWEVLKNDRLANFCPTSLDALEATVVAELEASPGRVRTAIRQTELPIHAVGHLVEAGGLR